jgi:hypothetical protein
MCINFAVSLPTQNILVDERDLRAGLFLKRELKLEFYTAVPGALENGRRRGY